MSKRKMYLKELDEAFIFVRSRLQNEKDKESDNYFLYLRQLKALEEIDKYVSSYVWVGKGDEVKERIKFIRDSQYDYELVRRELGLSPDALKGLVMRANKRLAEKIGASTIDLVISRNDTVSFGLTQFRICSGRYALSDILISDVYGKLPDPKVDFFHIFECENEIRFMYKYSRFGMGEELEKCSPEKLAFLRYILENSTERYIEEQKDLISVLQGVNISFEDYLEKLAALRAENGMDFEYYRDYAQNNEDEVVDEEVEMDFTPEEEYSSEEDFVPLRDDFDGLGDNEFVFFEEKASESENNSVDEEIFVPLFDKSAFNEEVSFSEKSEEEDEEDILEDF